MPEGTRKKKILLTGFGPFGKHSTNPSWTVVQDVALHWSACHELIIKEISVDYECVRLAIPQIWEQHHPDLVVHTGVSHSKDRLHLEKCAHSSGYEKLDIHQCCGPKDDACVCLSTDLSLEAIMDFCKARCENSKARIEVSTNAGRYLCEYIYFNSLQLNKYPVIFVHLPELDQGLSLFDVRTALESIVLGCAQQLDL